VSTEYGVRSTGAPDLPLAQGLEPSASGDGWAVYTGDARAVLPHLPDRSAQCVVTSPPYFALRDYGVIGQVGMEPTPAEYVDSLVEVFRQVRRILKDDGIVWLNLGDTYFSSAKGTGGCDPATSPKQSWKGGRNGQGFGAVRVSPGALAVKPKDLIGIPWRVAFALQEDGWYLRQDIIWHKPNPMPESVRDRCTKAHEYVFMLAKSARYFWDADAMKERASGASGWAKQRAKGVNTWKYNDTEERKAQTGQRVDASTFGDVGARNRRSVWTIPSKPYKCAHFAVMPPTLVEPCILAGSRAGDVVLDPFSGSGTTAAVAVQHGRRFVGCELNADYAQLTQARVAERLRAAEAEVSA